MEVDLLKMKLRKVLVSECGYGHACQRVIVDTCCFAKREEMIE